MLDQCIRDMSTEIQEARTALGMTQVQLKKSVNDLTKYEIQVTEYENMASRYTLSRDDTRARQMLKRKKEAEKMVDHLHAASENLQIEIDRLRETIRAKEQKHQEARDTKYSLLAQKQAVEALSKSNRIGTKYAGSGGAFREYERICEKIAESSAEQEALSYIPTDLGGTADMLLVEGSVDTELEDLKRKLGVSVENVAQIEHSKRDDSFDGEEFNHEKFNSGAGK